MNGIDWAKYLAYFIQIDTLQTPISEDRRTEIEDLLVEVLEISVPDWPRHWGTASGFGNGTEVVVHLHATPRSGPLGNLAAEFTGPLAIRVMRHNIGADTIAFFQQRAEEEHPLNGPEHVHFQRSLGVIQQGGYDLVIHEWVPGETLEWLRTNYWNIRPLSGDDAEKILQQIVVGVVIPSWAIATDTSGVLWDIRDANFVVSGYKKDPGTRIHVAYVDTANLRHLIEPRENRKGQIRQGLSRLRATMKRILKEAQGKWETRPKSYEREFMSALEESGLLDCLSLLPDQEPPSVELAETAFHTFLNRIREQGLLRPKS